MFIGTQVEVDSVEPVPPQPWPRLNRRNRFVKRDGSVSRIAFRFSLAFDPAFSPQRETFSRSIVPPLSLRPVQLEPDGHRECEVRTPGLSQVVCRSSRPGPTE